MKINRAVWCRIQARKRQLKMWRAAAARDGRTLADWIRRALNAAAGYEAILDESEAASR